MYDISYVLRDTQNHYLDHTGIKKKYEGKKRKKKYMIYHTVLRETQNYYLDPTGAYIY